MSDNISKYTLRVDSTLLKKFRYFSDCNGRSANKQIVQYMKQAVKSFEEEYGEIEIED